MCFFSVIILLPYYSLIYRKYLYINRTNYNNIDIFTKLIYTYTYILNTYTFYQYIV